MKYTFNKIIKTISRKIGNKRVIKRRAAKALSITMAGAVIATLPFTSMRNSLAAADTFMDLDTRIAETSDFSLVEIADDYEQASMGYFASGYEPFRQFKDVTDQTDGYEYDPTVGIGNVVADLQDESIMSIDPDAGETDYPMTYELRAYDPNTPPTPVMGENGEADEDYYILNAKQGLIGRELVPGYYVRSDTGRYYEDKSVIDIRDAKTSDITDLEMTTIGRGLKATVVGKGNSITFSLPSDAISNASTQTVIWTIGNTKIINIVDPTSSSVSVSKSRGDFYFFTGGGLTTITIKGLELGNSFVSAKVVNMSSSEISQSNIADIENRYVASDGSGNYKIYNGMVTCAEPAEEIVYYLGISEDGGNTYNYYKANESTRKLINIFIGDGEKEICAAIGTVAEDGTFARLSNFDTGFKYTWTSDHFDNLEIEGVGDAHPQTYEGTTITLKANAVNKYTELNVVVETTADNDYQNLKLPDKYWFDVEVVDSYYAVYNHNGDLKKIIPTREGVSIPTIIMTEDDYVSEEDAYIYTIKYLKWDSTESKYVKLSSQVASDTMSLSSLTSAEDDNTYTLKLRPKGTKNVDATISPENVGSDAEKLKFVLTYTTVVSDGYGFYDDRDSIGSNTSSLELTARVINSDDMLNHASKNESMYSYAWSIDGQSNAEITYDPSISKTAIITYTGEEKNYKVPIILNVYYNNGETTSSFQTAKYDIYFNCTGEALVYVKYGDKYYSVTKDQITSSNPIKVTNKDETAVVTGCIGTVLAQSNGNDIFIKKSGSYTYQWIVANVDSSVKTLNISNSSSASTQLISDGTGTYSFRLKIFDSNTSTTYEYENPYYIAFSFYNVYTISGEGITEKEICGTCSPDERISATATKTYNIGSSNENLEIKSVNFSGASEFSGIASLGDATSYSGTNPNIKAISPLNVKLGQNGTLTIVIGPTNSEDTDDYLTLIFTSLVVFKINGVSASGEYDLEDVTFPSASSENPYYRKYTIGTNVSSDIGLEKAVIPYESGCSANFDGGTAVSDDPEIQYIYTLTLKFTNEGIFAIDIYPTGESESKLILNVLATQLTLMTSMYFSTYSADAINDVDDIEHTNSIDEDTEDLEAGDEYTVTMSLSEVGNFVFETNMEIETEESFEATDTGDGSDSHGNGSSQQSGGSGNTSDNDDQSSGSSGDQGSGSDQQSGGSGDQNNNSDNQNGGSDQNSNSQDQNDNDSGQQGGSGDQGTDSGDDGNGSSDQTRLDLNGDSSNDKLYMTAAASDEGGSGSGSNDNSDDSHDNDNNDSSGNDNNSSSDNNGSNDNGSSSDGNDSNDNSSNNQSDESGKNDTTDNGSDDSNVSDSSESDEDEDEESDEGSGSSGGKDISGDTSLKEKSAEEERYIYTLPIIPDEPGIYTIILKPAGSEDEDDYVTIKVIIIDDSEKNDSKSSSKASSAASASTAASDEADSANSASAESSTDEDDASAEGSSGAQNASSTDGSSSTGGSASSGGTSGGSSTSDESSDTSPTSTGGGSDSAGEESGADPAADNESGSGGDSGDSNDNGGSGDSGGGAPAPSDDGGGSADQNSLGFVGVRHRNILVASAQGDPNSGSDPNNGGGSDQNGNGSGSETDTDQDTESRGEQKYTNAKTMEGGYYVLSCAEDTSLLEGVDSKDRYNFSLTKPSSGDYFAGYGYAYYITINYDWLKYYVFGDDETKTDDNNVNLTLYLYTLCETFDSESEGYGDRIKEVETNIADADLVYLSANGMTKDEKTAIGASEDDTKKIHDITTACAKGIVSASYSGSGATGSYPQAVIVNRSIFDDIETSGISADSKAKNYYYLARLLMTDIKDSIILNTPGLSSDNDDTFKGALTGIGNYTYFSSGSTNYEAKCDVSKVPGAFNFKNIYVAKYNSGDFTKGPDREYKNVPAVFNRFFAYSYTNSMISIGFEEVLKFIIEENVYRGRKNIGNMSYTVAPNVVTQYILIFAGSDLTLYKSTIKVLELEPCYAFKYYQYDDGSDDVAYRQAQRAEVFAERFAPNLSLLEDEDYMSGTFEKGSSAQETILNRVKITGMTTSEFAGIIGDPCEDYDVIYIGSQTVDTAVYTYEVKNSSTTSYYYGIKDTTTKIMNTQPTTVLCTGMTETVTDLTDNNGSVWEWHVENRVSDSYGRWRRRNNKGNYNSNVGKPNWITYTANDGTVYTWNGNNWYKSANYTVYNSSDMNGIVYAHVGDSMSDTAMYVDGADFGSAAVTHSASVSLRLSGNDITSIQEKELENFLELGYPVIVADDLFTYDTTMNGGSFSYNSSNAPSGISAGSGKFNTSNGTFAGKLDTNSQMYAFLKVGFGNSWGERKYTNFVTESIGSKFTDLITTGLNKSKLTLDVTSVPTEYVAVTNGNILDPNQCVFLSPGSDGQYYLNFDFTITDVANPDLLDATYTVQLFLDSNGDGRFAGSTDETKTDSQRSSTFTEEIMNLTISSGSTTSLLPYTSYHLTRQLPNGYYGSVAWKLKITNNKPNSDNSSLCSHDSITGICAVIPSGVEERIEINILQVFPYIPNSSADGGNSAISQTYDIKGAVDRDLSYQQYYVPTSDWYGMLENIPGYDVNIYSISSYEFATSYEKNYDPSKIEEESDILEVQLEGGHLVSPTTIAGNFNEAIDRNGDGDTDDANERPVGPTMLSAYDMVIVGFTDMFPNIPNENSIKSLVTYGKSGRAMLFTHDTTSWIYDTSLYPRAGLGTSTAGKTYKQFVVQSQWADWFASSYLSNAIRDLCGMDRFGYVGANNVYGSAYSTQYDPTPLLPNSGAALSGLYRLATTNHSIFGPSRQYQNLAVGGYTNRNSNKNAYYVSLVNEGTISKYPYNLEDEMFVASTHGQYFQLNLDMDNNADGESDITVWYTLDSRDMDSNGNGLVEPGEHVQNFINAVNKNGINDVYEASPHDVRNNYYIYNRGNISYSGVGHSAVKDCTTPEVQLFINTMIMAYNSGVKAASISITDDTFAKELTTDKIPYDAYAQDMANDSEAIAAGSESGVTTANTASDPDAPAYSSNTDVVNEYKYYPVYFTLTDLNVGIKTSAIKINFSYGKRSEQYNYDPETGTSTTTGLYGASYSSAKTPANLYPVYLCTVNSSGEIVSRTPAVVDSTGNYYLIYSDSISGSQSNAFVTYYLEVDVPIYDLNNNGSNVAMGDSDTLDIYVHSALTGTVNGVTSTVYSTDSMALLRQELYDLD